MASEAVFFLFGVMMGSLLTGVANVTYRAFHPPEKVLDSASLIQAMRKEEKERFRVVDNGEDYREDR